MPTARSEDLMGVGTSGTAAAAVVVIEREEGVKNEVMVDWEVRF